MAFGVPSIFTCATSEVCCFAIRFGEADVTLVSSGHRGREPCQPFLMFRLRIAPVRWRHLGDSVALPTHPFAQQFGGIVPFHESAALKRYSVEQYGHKMSSCSPMFR